MHTIFHLSGSSPHTIRLKSIIILMTMMTFSISLIAQKPNVQTIKVSGRVTSGEDNQSVPGANILIKGSTVGTTTNANGEYSINAPSNGTLNISSVGMTTQQISISGRAKVNISLIENVSTIDEVVVVGYGTSSKRLLSGAQTNIGETELKRTVNTTFDQALQGRAPNVYVAGNSGKPAFNKP